MPPSPPIAQPQRIACHAPSGPRACWAARRGRICESSGISRVSAIPSGPVTRASSSSLKLRPETSSMISDSSQNPVLQ